MSPHSRLTSAKAMAKSGHQKTHLLTLSKLVEIFFFFFLFAVFFFFVILFVGCVAVVFDLVYCLPFFFFFFFLLPFFTPLFVLFGEEGGEPLVFDKPESGLFLFFPFPFFFFFFFSCWDNPFIFDGSKKKGIPSFVQKTQNDLPLNHFSFTYHRPHTHSDLPPFLVCLIVFFLFFVFCFFFHS